MEPVLTRDDPDAVVDVAERQILKASEEDMQRESETERKVDEASKRGKEEEVSPEDANSEQIVVEANVPCSRPSPFESGAPTHLHWQPQLQVQLPETAEAILTTEATEAAEADCAMPTKHQEEDVEIDIGNPHVGGGDGSEGPETEPLTKDGGSDSGDREEETKIESASIPVLSSFVSRKDQSRRDLPLLCHVVDCNVSLIQQAEYYQRYRICRDHLRSFAILVDGEPQRFCQQCGRFHLLNAFDGNKRNCRARLAQHNRRRRKAGSGFSSGGLPPYGQRRKHSNDPMGSDDNDDDWVEEDTRRSKILRASSRPPGDVSKGLLRRSTSDAGLLNQLAVAAGMEGKSLGPERPLARSALLGPKTENAPSVHAPLPIRPKARVLQGQDSFLASGNHVDVAKNLSSTSAMLSALRQQLLNTTANAEGQRYFSEPVPSSTRSSHGWKSRMAHGIRPSFEGRGLHARLQQTPGGSTLLRPTLRQPHASRITQPSIAVPPIREAPQRHHTYAGTTTQHSLQRPLVTHQAMSKALPELEQLLGRQLLRQLLQGAGYSLPPSRQVTSSVKTTNPTEVANEILRMLSAHAVKEDVEGGIQVTPLEPNSVSGFSQPMPRYQSSGISQFALNTPSDSLEALRHLAATLPRSCSQGRGSSVLMPPSSQDRSEYQQPAVIQPTVTRAQVPNPFLQYRERSSGQVVASLGARPQREPMSPRLASGGYPCSPTTATAPIRAFSTIMSENYGFRESVTGIGQKVSEKPVRERQHGELSTTVQQILSALHADASSKPGGVETLQQELLTALKKIRGPASQSQHINQEPEGQTTAAATTAA